MGKPLSIEDRINIVHSAVNALRSLERSLTDLANLKEQYPQFMHEHYVLPSDLSDLAQRSVRWRSIAEQNLTNREILII